MKKLILTAAVIGFYFNTKADAHYGKYDGVKVVKGTAVINCKSKQNSLCAIVHSIDDGANNPGWLVTAYNEDGTTAYEQACSDVTSEEDGEGGTNIILSGLH